MSIRFEADDKDTKAQAYKDELALKITAQRFKEEEARAGQGKPDGAENFSATSGKPPLGAFLIDKLRAFGRAARETTSFVIDVVKAAGTALSAAFRVLGGKYFVRGAKKLGLFLSTRKDKEGQRHFAPWRLAGSLALVASLVGTSPYWGMGLYYYGTLQTYENVYIPDAALFQNQQFLTPGKPGALTTPRDEIYTVLGKIEEEKGVATPVRFDIDYNGYFFFYEDAMRPDLAASKLDSQSPYGVKATVKATGIYTKLPRFIRTKLIKWIDLRPEIVKVVKVEELTSMPHFVLIEGEDGSLRNLGDAPTAGRTVSGDLHRVHPSHPEKIAAFKPALQAPEGQH